MRLSNLKLTALAISLCAITAGCATIDPNSMLPRGTGIELVDVSTITTVNTSVSDHDEKMILIIKRLMQDTKYELAKRGIGSHMQNHTDTAKLKYDVRAINATRETTGYGGVISDSTKFELKYIITLESPDGTILWEEKDKQHDEELDGAVEKVAIRVAKKVAQHYRSE